MSPTMLEVMKNDFTRHVFTKGHEISQQCMRILLDMRSAQREDRTVCYWSVVEACKSAEFKIPFCSLDE